MQIQKKMDPISIGLGAANIGGGILGYIGQRNTNKTNLKLAEQARTHDVNMWNMQNAYNTPAMQRQRLEEAGLNPNLLYDSGANAGNAGNMPTALARKYKMKWHTYKLLICYRLYQSIRIGKFRRLKSIICKLKGSYYRADDR